MFYGAKASIFEKARGLRQHTTIPERVLWEKLKENRLLGFRFKRQHPIDNFIADFYCHKVRLVIEIDGASHSKQAEYDSNRTLIMNEFDLKVVRFRNEEVMDKLDFVLKKITIELQTRSKAIEKIPDAHP